MRHVFIDTNIFLNFYSFTSEHLNKLENIVDLITKKKIQLFLTQQVVDEFNRRREGVLANTLEYVEKLKPNVKGSLTSHNIKEVEEIRKHIEKLSTLSKKLHEKLKEQIKTKSLPADELIGKIFSLANIEPMTKEIFNKAKIRFERGNPPGKNQSYGDAINWESLLDKFPDNTDLHFVGTDRDYKSVINPSEFSPFLEEEWTKIKKSKIYFYDSISGFLKNNFPKVEITEEEVEEEKEVSLRSTPSFTFRSLRDFHPQSNIFIGGQESTPSFSIAGTYRPRSLYEKDEESESSYTFGKYYPGLKSIVKKDDTKKSISTGKRPYYEQFLPKDGKVPKGYKQVGSFIFKDEDSKRKKDTPSGYPIRTSLGKSGKETKPIGSIYESRIKPFKKYTDLSIPTLLSETKSEDEMKPPDKKKSKTD